MSCSLSSVLFPFEDMVVQFGLCRVVCVDLVGCCVSSYSLAAWISRSGLMGVAENVRLIDLHFPFVCGVFGGVLLLVRRGVCIHCLYVVKAFGPLSLFIIVESSCQAGPSVLRSVVVRWCGRLGGCA